MTSGVRARFDFPRDVAFRCTRCVVCCGDTKSRKRHILLLARNAEAIAKAVLKPVDRFATEVKGCEPYVYEMKKTEQMGKCFFLNGENCNIYGMRPLVCRFYPFELTATKQGKPRFLFAEECPGIGRGKRLERVYFEKLFELAYDQLQTR